MNGIFQQVDLPDRDFKRISQVVYDHCGINLTSDKKGLVRSRLSKILRKHGYTSYKEYLDLVLIKSDTPEFTEFIDLLSTNLTSFFREQKHFDYLREILIPRLLSEGSHMSRFRLRGWSAACSTGEEPYTLAMTLLEALPDLRNADIRVLASDISTRVLHKAKAGQYPVARLATVPPALRKKYFTECVDGGAPGLSANEELRKMLIFKQINLMDEWPLTTPLDFIFCRNVLIYFDKPTHQALVERFYKILKPGGVLFIGHSESLSGIQHKFKNARPSIYIKGSGV